MEYEHRYGQVQRSKYDCLLFNLDDTLYPLSAGLATSVLKNIQDYMVEKLGIEESKSMTCVIYCTRIMVLQWQALDVLCIDNSGVSFTGSGRCSSQSSIGSINGCFSGSMSEDNEGDDYDNGCLDDWETVVDALMMLFVLGACLAFPFRRSFMGVAPVPNQMFGCELYCTPSISLKLSESKSFRRRGAKGF
ncbi:unnamed protein product [Fraxinus pennsylvanica]|uniref:Uncharacterized protein n=1 Tax=Fraxinus pennsylvanica TaxID=56036 RepID=A0AAD2DP55_9LAMI|nr:unnamed protein product [Fraxinus pennsylvanica]